MNELTGVDFAWVGLGAIPGALCRYYISLWALKHLPTKFPWWTFTINVSGTFLIGFVAMWVAPAGLAAGIKLAIISGFLGSYTTFSTFALDTNNLRRSSSKTLTLLYGLGSPVAGFVGGELGAALGEWILAKGG